MSAEMGHELNESFPELDEVRIAAEHLRSNAELYALDPDLPENVTVNVTDDGRAIFTMHRSPTQYDALSIFYGDNGTLCVKEQRQRPTIEAFSQTVRRTSVYPLASNDFGIRSSEVGRLANDGTLEGVATDSVILDPLNANECNNILQTIRLLSGYGAEQTPRSKGWLRWMGFSRP